MAGVLIALAATTTLHVIEPPPVDNPLAGPAVQTAVLSEARSLVQRGFNGTVEPLTIEADTAAIGLIDLTEEQRAEFERIAAERSGIFSKAIREHLDLLMELGGIDAKEQPAEFLRILTRVGEALSEYRARGTMMHEMSPYLTAEQRREVRRLMGEYLQARTETIRRETGPDTPWAAIAIRLQVETLGAMAKSAIESAAAMGSAMFDALSERLGLTPDQQAKIRKIYEPIAIKEFQGKPVGRIARVRALFQISHLLTEEQMVRLVEYTREERQAVNARVAPEPGVMQRESDR